MDQDWEQVVIKKKTPKPQNNDQALRMARQDGAAVETVKKYNAGKNSTTKPTANAKKLDDETEELAHETVSHTVALRIQQARLAKKMTQKELATKINEKATVINDYEAGRAIPNNQILAKLERALDTKLRGKVTP